MKVKKRILLGLYTIISIGFTGCGNVALNPAPNPHTDSNKYAKKDQYEKGYKDAIQKESRKWEKRGYDKALKIVKNYSTDIRAFEAGKYALKNKFVTYPKLISMSKNGSINLKSLGCEIRPDMTVNDIFHYYNKNKVSIPTLDESDFYRNPQPVKSVTYRKAPTYTPPNRTIPIQQTVSMPTENPNSVAKYVPNNAERKMSYLTLPKSYKSKDAIDKFSLDCRESNNNYECVFASFAEKKWFCKESKLCRG